MRDTENATARLWSDCGPLVRHGDDELMEAFLGLAAAVAALAIVGRGLQARRSAAMLAGGGPERAIPVAAFDQIDEIVEQQRCGCGGRFDPRGEGPVAADRHLRQVSIECRDCERERRLFFDLRPIAAGSDRESTRSRLDVEESDDNT